MKQQNVVHITTAILAFLFFGSVAWADSVGVALTQTSVTTTAGSTITFDAAITNFSTTDTIFLNGDGSTTSSLLLTVDDTPFLANFPLSLDPNEVSGPFALFNVIIDASIPTGIYDFNSFSILGGSDGNAFGTIGSVDFSVTVDNVTTPEPWTQFLLLSGLLVLGMLRKFVIPVKPGELMGKCSAIHRRN